MGDDEKDDALVEKGIVLDRTGSLVAPPPVAKLDATLDIWNPFCAPDPDPDPKPNAPDNPPNAVV